MNKVQLIGRLGKDPKGGVAGGHVYSNLSIATNEFFYDKEGVKIERTTWHRVVCWGKTAEFANEFLFGGRLVFLEGQMQYRKYKDSAGETRTVAEVIARYVRALEPAPVYKAHEQSGEFPWG